MPQSAAGLFDLFALRVWGQVVARNRAGWVAALAVDFSVVRPGIRHADAPTALPADERRPDVGRSARALRCLHLTRPEPRILALPRRGRDLPTARGGSRCPPADCRRAGDPPQRIELPRIEPHAFAGDAYVDRTGGGGYHRQPRVADGAVG